MNKRRLWLASITAPLTPVVAVTLVPMFFTQGQAFGNWLPVVILLGLFTSYLGAFVLGLPLVFLLERFGRLNLVALALAGAASGALIFSCFLYFLGLMLGSQSNIGFTEAVWGAGLGLMVAVPFSLVAGITSAGKGRS
ncbi:hypothetical protein ACJO5Y_18190 [Marinobacter sp. GN3S48]|uniref:hypothetical protein n=1 Tax=Marinobacter sp. GN3S48 TaxID=3382302 RepID=UPI00387ACF81